jgi:hypothetical protein
MLDVRLFGVLVSHFLFFLVLAIVFFYSKLRVDKDFLFFNAPYLFLFAFGMFAYVVVLPSYSTDDLYYIFFNNKDLLSEILLAFVIYLFAVKKEWGTAVILLFIEIYFLTNFIYWIFVNIYPDIALFFHSGETNLPELLHGRERLLGWEPSYTVPVSILFAAIYTLLYKKKIYLYLILAFTLYIVIAGGSKTAYIFLFVSLFVWLYFTFSAKIKNKKIFLLIVSIVFLGSTFFTLNYLDSKKHYSNYKNLDLYHQYQIISFITRTELITAALKEIIANPMGYGFGNGGVHLANTVQKNIDNFTSIEIKKAEKYANSPKSQLLDYTLSGGIVFLFLLFRQFASLIKDINTLTDKRKEKLLKIILIFLFGTIVIGERIPFILILNFIWIISLSLPKDDQEKSIDEKN